jgi:hypothetical protein
MLKVFYDTVSEIIALFKSTEPHGVGVELYRISKGARHLQDVRLSGMDQSLRLQDFMAMSFVLLPVRFWEGQIVPNTYTGISVLICWNNTFDERVTTDTPHAQTENLYRMEFLRVVRASRTARY